MQGVESPGPDDQEFEEEGITYRWNPVHRKYLPDGLHIDADRERTGGTTKCSSEPVAAAAAAAEVPEYTAEMMRFEATAEPVVTLEDARREEEESAALAEKLQDVKEQGGKVRHVNPVPP